MAMRYAAAEGASVEEQRFARVEGFGYLLLLPTRSRVRPLTAFAMTALLILVGALFAWGAAEYGSSLNSEKAACLRKEVSLRDACLDDLAGDLTSLRAPYPYLVLAATLASLAIATYVTVAVVRLVDERRRHHAALLAEERMGRLEAAFVAGHLTDRTYARFKRWLRDSGDLEVKGDDFVQAGRVGRAIALFAFPLSLLPILALFAQAALVPDAGSDVRRTLGEATGALASNPLLQNPLLDVALRPVGELLQDSTGALDLVGLQRVVGPSLAVAGIFWVLTAIAAAFLLTFGRDARRVEEDKFQSSWSMVLAAARARHADPSKAPLSLEEEGEMAA